MVMTDPIADMLTRIRNANQMRHENVTVPASTLKINILKVLKEEGFIADYELVKDEKQAINLSELGLRNTRYFIGSPPDHIFLFMAYLLNSNCTVIKYLSY